MKRNIEIVEGMRSALEKRDYMGFVDHFAEDGIYELRYTQKGKPSKFEGIAEIRKFFTNNMTARNGLFEIQRVNLIFNEGAEEGLVFVEFTLEGKTYANNEDFKIASSVAIIKIKNGQVSNYRDFPNISGFAQVLGR